MISSGCYWILHMDSCWGCIDHSWILYFIFQGYSWMHASFASNGLKMMPGFAAFLLALNFGRFSRLLSEICYGYGRSLVSNSLCYLNLFLLLPGLTRCIGTSLPDESTCKHERAVCTKVPFSFRNTSLNYICTILEISVSIENGSFCSDHWFSPYLHGH